MDEWKPAGFGGATDCAGRGRQSRTKEDPEAADPRARFARALARSVFGRNYWSEEHAEEVRRSLARKKKPR